MTTTAITMGQEDMGDMVDLEESGVRIDRIAAHMAGMEDGITDRTERKTNARNITNAAARLPTLISLASHQSTSSNTNFLELEHEFISE